MRFFTALSLLGLAALASSAPVANPLSLNKRAGVLTEQSYADFQVSDGVSGNAFAEVNAKFPVCL